MTRDKGVEEGATLGGRFTLPDGRQILGDLTIAGSKTSLYLHDEAFFGIGYEQNANLVGLLHDRTNVTILDASVRSPFGSVSGTGGSYHFAEVLPAFILSGQHHFDARTSSVASIRFHADDAEEIFYDFDAMGMVIDPRPLIEQVTAANAHWIQREIRTGPEPQILYFAGRTEIASVETALGHVRIFHDPHSSGPLSSPRFVAVRNRVLVEISFPDAVTFHEALDRLMAIRRLLGLLAGRPQNIDSVRIETSGDGAHRLLDVYWTRPPRREPLWEDGRPHAAEILVSAVQDPQEFATVLERWVAADRDRLEARVRLASCFDQQSHFTIDRLVGAANMFDILPASVFRETPPLVPAVADAKRQARQIFRSLPDSSERDSILNALGRLSRPTLRNKVRQRAALVSTALQAPLTDLDLVTDEAVKCRNHYVHGSPGSFAYAEHPAMTVFLTSALEFLFAAADLLDAGWDIARWRAHGSVLAHPFNRVLIEWDQLAGRLRALREPAPTSGSGS